MLRTPRRTVPALFAGLCLSAPVAAQTPAPQGAEFQVNTFTTDYQRAPSVAGVGSAGGFVVAWQSFTQDGYDEGVFGQRRHQLQLDRDRWQPGHAADRGGARARCGSPAWTRWPRSATASASISCRSAARRVPPSSS